MEKIASFQVNHLTLKRGVYVSRRDEAGNQVLTTFDLRMKTPNLEPVINTAPMHTLEHLGATFLRNHSEWKDKIIYFGPMGCRTGFYLIIAGNYQPSDILELLKEMYSFMSAYDGEVPGADPKSCGNYLDMNLPMAKYEASRYLNEVLNVITADEMVYPD